MSTVRARPTDKVDAVTRLANTLVDEIQSRDKRLRDDIWISRVQRTFLHFIGVYHQENALNSMIDRLPEELKRVA